MKQRVKDLCDQGSRLFTQRQPIVSMWQEIADHFYVERADFTASRSIGTDFASHLMSGFPAMCRRDLANQISAMLRPRGQPWFHPRTQHEAINKDQRAKAWLDWAGDKVMKPAMYEPRSGFVRATKEGDHDFASFGQAVLQCTPNMDYDGLLIRAHHLRDVAWEENAELQVDRIHRRQNMTARDLCKWFKGKGEIHSSVIDAKDREPFKKIKVEHIIIPADDYDVSKSRNSGRFPYVSIYIDTENQTILEEVPARRTGYVIPRWQTVAGSQYAYSPAAVIAMPDARMLQRMTLTLLEAGEKAVDPPLIAVGEAISGGIRTYAGGVTYVDADYDERSGEAVRQMNVDKSGLQWGVDREQRVHEMIMRAFYLNQIQLPEVSGDMTAFETQKRVEEYIRNALPLFEPMETEYNGGICEMIFDILLEMKAFGDMRDMPEVLQGQDIRFSFESPLQAAQARANSQAFLQSAEILNIAAQIDPNTRLVFDATQATRDAIEGAGAPANWLVPQDEADQRKKEADEEAAEAAESAAMMQEVGGAAAVGQQAGDAMQSIGKAMGMEAA